MSRTVGNWCFAYFSDDTRGYNDFYTGLSGLSVVWCGIYPALNPVLYLQTCFHPVYLGAGCSFGRHTHCFFFYPHVSSTPRQSARFPSFISLKPSVCLYFLQQISLN
ncbi:hypothetical protein ILYODFUR_023122 [Ilyodon furcidens]|uniref:Uncharacterized protein n=1 Tax=Ilyodon furcidens TaxID=33524 RepID=A0ABV0UIE0_9TELE